MGRYSEDQLLPLSGIQHLSYCPRQWALIHVEQQWIENVLTYTGQIVHEKVHNTTSMESRGDTLLVRSMHISSTALGLYGVADMVEFTRGARGVVLPRKKGLWWPRPVEYKAGKSKEMSCDRVQLCAQAICLEEIYGIEIDEGCIYYDRVNRRETVRFCEELRKETADLAERMHDLYRRGITPPAVPNKGCQRCSMVDVCLPTISRKSSLSSYLDRALKD